MSNLGIKLRCKCVCTLSASCSGVNTSFLQSIQVVIKSMETGISEDV